MCDQIVSYCVAAGSTDRAVEVLKEFSAACAQLSLAQKGLAARNMEDLRLPEDFTVAVQKVCALAHDMDVEGYSQATMVYREERGDFPLEGAPKVVNLQDESQAATSLQRDELLTERLENLNEDGLLSGVGEDADILGDATPAEAWERDQAEILLRQIKDSLAPVNTVKPETFDIGSILAPTAREAGKGSSQPVLSWPEDLTMRTGASAMDVNIGKKVQGASSMKGSRGDTLSQQAMERLCEPPVQPDCGISPEVKNVLTDLLNMLG